MKKIIILISLLFFSFATAGSNVEKVIKNVQKKYKDVKLISINFKQINRFKLSGLENEIFGSLWLSQSDKFRFETEDQTIVSDGKTYWQYNKLENQVLIDNAKKSNQDIFINNFLFKIDDLYYGQILSEQKEGKQKIFEIKLTPKNTEESFFRYIKVWIVNKSWEIKKVNYIDYNENESEYLIEKLDLNPKITGKEFIFEIPEDMEVVDLRF